MISKHIANISVAFFGLCNLMAFMYCLYALLSLYGFVEIGSQWGRDPVTEYLEAAVFFGFFTVVQAGLAVHFHFIKLPQLQQELGL